MNKFTELNTNECSRGINESSLTPEKKFGSTLLIFINTY